MMKPADQAATMVEADQTTRSNLVVGLAVLAVFSAMPAWRPFLFSDNYALYYSFRLTLFVAAATMLLFYGRTFRADLSIGSNVAFKTDYGDPLLTLRAFACAIVLIGHGAGIVFQPVSFGHEAASSTSFWLLFPLPWAGVWVFFTLSGYLMGKVFFTGRYELSRDGVLQFYRSRALRILPLAYFAIAIIVLFSRSDALATAQIKHLIAKLLFDYDGTSPLSLIGLLWSIATEMQFYLIAPFLALGLHAASRRLNPALIATGFLLWGVGYRSICAASGASWTISIYTPLLGNLDLFAVGMLASVIVQKYKFAWPRIIYGLILLDVLYVFAAYVCSAMNVDGLWVAPLQTYAPTIFCLGTVAVILIFENAVRAGKQPDRVSRAVIVSTQLFGILTYAIYIWHAPIFEAYARTMSKPISSQQTIAALLIASTLVVGFSWFTYRFIEKPFDDIKKRRRAVNPSFLETAKPV